MLTMIEYNSSFLNGYPKRTQRHDQTMSSDRVNPSAQGWGVAAFIIALAIIAHVTAYSIHQATYLKPDAKAAALHGK